MAKKKQKTIKLPKATEVNEFKVNDLVGAKVKGYPLWPGRIETIEYVNNKRKYTVRFFGTNDSSDSFSEILPYDQCLVKFKPSGTKRLKEAIELSKLEYNSQQTNQHHKEPLNDIKEEEEEEVSPVANHSTVSSPVQKEVSAASKDERLEDEEEPMKEPKEEKKEELAHKPKEEPIEEPPKEPLEKPKKEKKIKEERRRGKKRGVAVVETEIEVKKMKKMKRKVGAKEKIKTEDKSQEQLEDINENKMEIDLPDTTTASITIMKSHLTVASPKSQSDDQLERTSPSKHQLSLESKNDPPTQLMTDPKSEGENVMISKAAMQTTIAKLKEKVAEKIREKEKRKSELRERKLHKKISIKLEVFNKKLQRFSIISTKISIAKSVGRDDIGEWNQAAQAFHSVLPALAKCINTVTDIGLKASNLTQCRECHETLRKISSSIKLSEKNNSVPMKIKKELNGCKRCIKNHSEIKKFIKKDFENLEKGMIERKENDA